MTDNNIAPSLRSRQQANMASESKINGSSSSSSFSDSGPASRPTYPAPSKRSSPFLPTPLETVVLLVYPTILAFGTLFSILSPQTRGSPYDATGHSHVASAAPSYFARKDNVFNTVFVKRGWAWISVSFASFVLTHGGLGTEAKKLRAGIRWGLVTAWWVLVTQWCFGPALIDRGFRFTGGKCEVAREAVSEGAADKKDAFTAAACRAAGGRWSGGHDISGHVFLLVLGSFFLVQEVGWVVYRARRRREGGEERAVVMPDGAVKGASVEAETETESAQPSGGVAGGDDDEKASLGFGGRFAVGVIALCLWMLLMTAIYFHTWFEKLTGLLVAIMGIYPVYILPRWVPGLRALVGLPGI